MRWGQGPAWGPHGEGDGAGEGCNRDRDIEARMRLRRWGQWDEMKEELWWVGGQGPRRGVRADWYTLGVNWEGWDGAEGPALGGG